MNQSLETSAEKHHNTNRTSGSFLGFIFEHVCRRQDICTDWIQVKWERDSAQNRKEVGARRDEVGEHKVLDSEGSLLHRVICSKFLGTARAWAGWRWGLGWDPGWKADSEPLWFC